MPQDKEDKAKEEPKKKKKSAKLKKSTVKKISAVIVLLVVLGVILFFALRTLRPEQVVAQVNDEKITKRELDAKFAQLPEQYKIFLTKDNFLDQVINVKLLLQESEKQGIRVTEAELEAELDSLRKMAPTEEDFQKLLQQQNLGLEDLKDQLREQIEINKLLNITVLSKITVAEQKIRDYYQANKEYFDKSNLTYNGSKPQIKQILLNDISSNAAEIYINQLRVDAFIKIGRKQITTKVETFTKVEDPICKDNGKPILRLYSTRSNSASKWISKSYEKVASEYEGKVVVYYWQLDTGDDLLTAGKETGLPPSEVEIFKKYSPKNAVPVFVLGCKYIRVANGYDTLEGEEAEFRRIIDRLLV